eukprot:m.336659 g.336659  ORF g.336659 m.336659 type:complete len:349 (+) comp17915_c0_seq1:61-1107(+)
MKKGLVFLMLLGCTVAQEDCYITPDGLSGACSGDVLGLFVIGAEGACEAGSGATFISAAYLESISSIETVQGDVEFCGVDASDINGTVSFSLLTSITGKVLITNTVGLKHVDFPEMSVLDNLEVSFNEDLREVELHGVTTITGSIAIIQNPSINKIGVSGLDTLGTNGTAYMNDGISYALYVRHNANLSDLCDLHPESLGFGIFICNNSQAGLQIRDHIADSGVATTLCNTTTLGPDDKCPCAEAYYEPKNCKSGGDPGRKKGKLGSLGPQAVGAVSGVAVALAVGMFGGYAFVKYRKKRLEQSNERLASYEMGHSERAPLIGSAPPAYAPNEKPPDYSAPQSASVMK